MSKNTFPDHLALFVIKRLQLNNRRSLGLEQHCDPSDYRRISNNTREDVIRDMDNIVDCFFQNNKIFQDWYEDLTYGWKLEIAGDILKKAKSPNPND